MTDKEKIMAEIERLIANLGEQRDVLLEELLDFINSLPEEPTNTLWHDSNKEQPENHRTVVVWSPKTMSGDVLTFCVTINKDRLWAYLDDLLQV